MASSYVPLQEVRRSWFEYRIEIKKESYEHILQEQPVSHRRMAIFDCMPVELTVATELKSNKEGRIAVRGSISQRCDDHSRNNHLLASALFVVISRLEFTITGCLLHFGMKLWHCMILVRIHNARKEVVVQQRSSMGTASSQMKMDTFGYAFHSREKWSVSTCRSTALSCRCGRVSCWI
ncbi:hypothetical protein T01_11239 [Trichinella spiralis]|uniref:Uncharacterized protein n=1 Tax=Trichinella spiralis TaxID=6334 RepID=A0A0V1AYY5_TRISP|nr:hypothetical protein T01_11239 [Trichinella spiralis]